MNFDLPCPNYLAGWHARIVAARAAGATKQVSCQPRRENRLARDLLRNRVRVRQPRMRPRSANAVNLRTAVPAGTRSASARLWLSNLTTCRGEAGTGRAAEGKHGP